MDANEYIRPPGTYYDIVLHPVDVNRTIEVAIVQEHRFAFFYWMKWGRKHKPLAPPSLVSLDWHQDLAAPCEMEREWLRALDTNDYKAVSFFCWDQLHPNNDGHVLAAAYLNIIGNIYVVQKQEDASVEYFEDIAGGIHVIHCYESIDALIEDVTLQEHPSVILDVDLDYFTESAESCGGGERVELVPAEDIHGFLHPNGKLMSWVFPRLCGMTIATEPEFCGSLVNANRLFSVVDDVLFSPPLLSHRSGWRHHAKHDILGD